MIESPSPVEVSRRWFVWLLCLAILSFYEARLMGMFEFEERLANMSLGIAHGYTGQIVFQNRIAGPFLVLGVSGLTGLSFAKCHALFDIAMIFFSNLISFVLFRRVIANDLATYAMVLLNAAGLVVVHFHGLVQDFDLIDFNTMFLFAYAVFFEFPLWCIIPVFLVELLNREVAGFIALWMMIDGAVSLLRKVDRLPLIKIGTGIGLMVVGIVWTKFIRDYLAKSHPLDIHPEKMFYGENLQIAQNIEDMLRPSIMLYTLSGMLIVLFIRYALYPGVGALQFIKVGLLLAAFLIFLFIFAIMSETRVWIELVPFMVMMYLIPLGLAARYRSSSSA